MEKDDLYTVIIGAKEHSVIKTNEGYCLFDNEKKRIMSQYYDSIMRICDLDLKPIEHHYLVRKTDKYNYIRVYRFFEGDIYYQELSKVWFDYASSLESEYYGFQVEVDGIIRYIDLYNM